MPFGVSTLSFFGIQNVTSKTEADSPLSGPVFHWKTTYYATNGSSCGTSKTEADSPLSGPVFHWKTTYYATNGSSCGTSKTEADSPLSGPVFHWKTIYSLSIPENKNESASKSKGFDYSRSSYGSLENTYSLPVLEYKNRPQASISELKTYYISKAGFFNASHKIFTDTNSRTQIIQILRERAVENWGGASDKTLLHFNLQFGPIK